MAIANITNVELLRNEAKELTTAVAVDGSLGAKVNYDNKDDGRILLLITNGSSSATKKATITKGTAVQGVADLVVSIPQNKTYALVVESGKFIQTTGENKGHIVIKGESTDIKVQAVELP